MSKSKLIARIRENAEWIALGHNDTSAVRCELAEDLRKLASVVESDSTDPTAAGDSYMMLCNALAELVAS